MGRRRRAIGAFPVTIGHLNIIVCDLVNAQAPVAIEAQRIEIFFNLQIFFKNHGFNILPSWKDVRAYEDSVTPNIVRKHFGVEVSYIEALRLTFQQILTQDQQ